MGKWTKDELERAILLIKEGKSYKEISKIVNKTERAVEVKLNRCGEKLSLYSNKYLEYNCLCCKNKIYDKTERKFCSSSCSAKYNNRLRTIKGKGKINNCLTCNEEIKNKKYCNNKCQAKYEWIKLVQEIENGSTTLHEVSYKKYLINKYGNKCMDCGWCQVHKLTGRVPIQLEHIDGNSENNNISNLKLLCPNCHSLTPTYGALNKGQGRKNRYKKNKNKL